MRIISTYSDYYDSVQKLGQDHNLIWLRKPEVVNLPCERRHPFPEFRSGCWKSKGLQTIEYAVGFCGIVYPVIRLALWNRNTGQYECKTYCFSIEDIDKFIKINTRNKEEIEHYFAPKKKYWSLDYPCGISRQTWVAYLENWTAIKNQFVDIFLEKHCPIFVAVQTSYRGDQEVTYNAKLKSLEWYRKFPPFQAYQELAMFYGGMAQNNCPLPRVKDKDMVTAKGFDKFSFRKDKKWKK